MENNIMPKRNLPRDLFLHLLAIVTLYWSAVSFVTLLWQVINYFFPDILNYSYYASFTGPMRFAVASLIIVFPIFIFVSWCLNKIYAKEAEVRESRIRKWLIYFTLFVTSLVIIGDLVSVINTFLGGEIKVRFILKALSILLVAVVVFWYYLDDVRRSTPTKSAKYFAWTSGAIILIAVIGSFFIIGSPASARLIQYDLQKVNDLQVIQSQIVKYWQQKEILPSNLSELSDTISGYKVPVDQQTGVTYEYNIKDATALIFELCATFNKPSQSNQNIANKTMPIAGIPDSYNQNWVHKTGRICFERTIDKQLYPPLSSPTK
jgi:hypothetical protein